jgi:ribulose-phosphate 3-epimerase
MRIVPAILTDRPEELRDLLTNAVTFTDYVQIDFMDGRFVPSKSVLPRHMDGLGIDVGREAHLMVQRPKTYLDDLRSLGFKRTIFHREAVADPRVIIRGIKAHGMEAGIAINSDTLISGVEAFVPELDSVLFMSVNPGFYGSPFIPSVLQKVERFRRDHPGMLIGIDGGVALDNLSQIKSVGVDYACVGSRIFLSDDPAGSYRAFEEGARGG